MEENEPMLRAQPCPYDVMPASVRSAVNVGTQNGWSTSVSFAIGPLPDAIQSVVFRARRGPVRLVSRHEAKATDDTLGFKKAFIQERDVENGWPPRLGWRALQAALKVTP